MKNPIEQDIQKAIKTYLSLAGWFVIKNSTTGIYKPSTQHFIPSTAKGTADLTAIKDGRVIMIEVKRKYNKQSVDQLIFEKNWTEHGGEYWLIYNLDELITKLNIVT